MVVTSEDWARLQERLRSGSLLISYVAAAINENPPALGDEMARLQAMHSDGSRSGQQATWPSRLTSASEEEGRHIWKRLFDSAVPVLAKTVPDLEQFLVALARLDAVPPRRRP